MATNVRICVSMNALIIKALLLDCSCCRFSLHSMGHEHFRLPEEKHGASPAIAASLEPSETPWSLGSQRRELSPYSAVNQYGSLDNNNDCNSAKCSRNARNVRTDFRKESSSYDENTRTHHTKCKGSKISTLDNCIEPIGSSWQCGSAKGERYSGTMNDSLVGEGYSFSGAVNSKPEQRIANMEGRNYGSKAKLTSSRLLYKSHTDILQSKSSKSTVDGNGTSVQYYKTRWGRESAVNGVSGRQTIDEACGMTNIRQRRRSQMCGLRWSVRAGDAASCAGGKSKLHVTQSRPETEVDYEEPRTEETSFLAEDSVQTGAQLQLLLHKRRDMSRQQHESDTDKQLEEVTGLPLQNLVRKHLKLESNPQQIYQQHSQKYAQVAVLARRLSIPSSYRVSSNTARSTNTETTLNTRELFDIRPQRTLLEKKTRKNKAVAEQAMSKQGGTDHTSRYAEFVKQEAAELGVKDNVLRGSKTAATLLTILLSNWTAILPHVLFLSLLHYIYDMDRRLEQTALVHSRARRRLAQEILREQDRHMRTSTRRSRVTKRKNTFEENTLQKELKLRGEPLQQHLSFQTLKVPQYMLPVQYPGTRAPPF